MDFGAIQDERDRAAIARLDDEIRWERRRRDLARSRGDFGQAAFCKHLVTQKQRLRDDYLIAIERRAESRARQVRP